MDPAGHVLVSMLHRRVCSRGVASPGTGCLVRTSRRFISGLTQLVRGWPVRGREEEGEGYLRTKLASGTAQANYNTGYGNNWDQSQQQGNWQQSGGGQQQGPWANGGSGPQGYPSSECSSFQQCLFELTVN